MEAGSPATAPEGTRSSMSCAMLTAARDSSTAPIQHSETLGLLQAVLIDDDMKVLNLPCNGFRNFYRERLTRLRKQRLLHIAIGNPDHFAIVVVETGDDVRNIHRLARLVQYLSMQHGAALGVLFQLLIHDSDNRIGRGRYQCVFHVHTDVLHFGEAGVWEIDAIRLDLLGQQYVQNLIEAALIVDGVPGC